MPSFTYSDLPGSGSAKVTFDTDTFWTRGDIIVPIMHALQEQIASMYGRVTKTRLGRKIEIKMPLYGFWDSLSVLFPSYFTNYIYGARIGYGTDNALVILARNGDKITIGNCRITGLSNLKLAANQQIFSADVTFTGLITNASGGDPTQSDAYYTRATGQTYAEGNFPQANFQSRTWSGAWGSRTGLTNILTQDGWAVNWEIKTTEDVVDGVGPVDLFTDLFWASATCIPVGPTLAQLDGGLDFQGSANAAVGADVGGDSAADVDDLVLTNDTADHTITLYNAAFSGMEDVYAPSKKRTRNAKWETGSRVFSSGAPTAIIAVT